MNNIEESRSHQNSPKNSQIKNDDPKSKTAFHKAVKIPDTKEVIQKQ